MKTAVAICAVVWALVGVTVLAHIYIPGWGRVITVCEDGRAPGDRQVTACRSHLGILLDPDAPMLIDAEEQ